MIFFFEGVRIRSVKLKVEAATKIFKLKVEVAKNILNSY
jgi:hypothetical protein